MLYKTQQIEKQKQVDQSNDNISKLVYDLEIKTNIKSWDNLYQEVSIGNVHISIQDSNTICHLASQFLPQEDHLYSYKVIYILGLISGTSDYHSSLLIKNGCVEKLVNYLDARVDPTLFSHAINVLLNVFDSLGSIQLGNHVLDDFCRKLLFLCFEVDKYIDMMRSSLFSLFRKGISFTDFSSDESYQMYIKFRDNIFCSMCIISPIDTNSSLMAFHSLLQKYFGLYNDIIVDGTIASLIGFIDVKNDDKTATILRIIYPLFSNSDYADALISNQIIKKLLDMIQIPSSILYEKALESILLMSNVSIECCQLLVEFQFFDSPQHFRGRFLSKELSLKILHNVIKHVSIQINTNQESYLVPYLVEMIQSTDFSTALIAFEVSIHFYNKGVNIDLNHLVNLLSDSFDSTEIIVIQGILEKNMIK